MTKENCDERALEEREQPAGRAVNHSHWGPFLVDSDGRQVHGIRPHPIDPQPSPLLKNISSAVHHETRIEQPMIRAGWLDRGPGADSSRGADPFVPVTWDEALSLLAVELRRVIDEYGNEAIYGGSYGWASAGRFHHAQSQIHRFLNCLGGYTRSVNNYSTGASMVLFPHLVGAGVDALRGGTSWEMIAEHTELLVTFGGIPRKNVGVAPGGLGRHTAENGLDAVLKSGTELVLFSPIRDDLATGDDSTTWHPLVPGTDAAVMLAIAFVLITEELYDHAFIDRYTVGFERFRDHVLGADGTPAKTPNWAEEISEIASEDIRALARKMADSRTLITVTWSLQRAEHGEQPPWLGLTLSAMLGQLGLPGGGFGHGYGSMADAGLSLLDYHPPRFPQGINPVPTYIPVARVADMLLQPGEKFDYNGSRLTYPHTRLVYWCGGNPFHHHQNIPRLRRALYRPDTLVVHDPYWTPMARHSDIILPATTTLERNDIGAARHDSILFAMQQAIDPVGGSRNDFEILGDLAGRLGIYDAFTMGRDEDAWLRHMYEDWRTYMSTDHDAWLPDFDEFWQRGHLSLPEARNKAVFLSDFRAAPEKRPLQTPSGKIEIFSERIGSFGYDDCPGYPTWLEPSEWLGSGSKNYRSTLIMIANQPATRLHSQHDVGDYSQASKIQGREPIRMHPRDAEAREISAGQVVRVFNSRGACLAGVLISKAVRPGVVQLSTGAWYSPENPADPDSLCVHGNPNMLTRDHGASRLSQGCTGQHALVEVEPYYGPIPKVGAHQSPPIAWREEKSGPSL